MRKKLERSFSKSRRHQPFSPHYGRNLLCVCQQFENNKRPASALTALHSTLMPLMMYGLPGSEVIADGPGRVS